MDGRIKKQRELGTEDLKKEESERQRDRWRIKAWRIEGRKLRDGAREKRRN